MTDLNGLDPYGRGPSLTEWTQGEVVRALTRLSSSLERFETSVDRAFEGLDQKYVLREVYERDMAELRERNSSSTAWLRELVAPLVAGLTVAIVMLILTRSLR